MKRLSIRVQSGLFSEPGVVKLLGGGRPAARIWVGYTYILYLSPHEFLVELVTRAPNSI